MTPTPATQPDQPEGSTPAQSKPGMNSKMTTPLLEENGSDHGRLDGCAADSLTTAPNPKTPDELSLSPENKKLVELFSMTLGYMPDVLPIDGDLMGPLLNAAREEGRIAALYGAADGGGVGGVEALEDLARSRAVRDDVCDQLNKIDALYYPKYLDDAFIAFLNNPEVRAALSHLPSGGETPSVENPFAVNPSFLDEMVKHIKRCDDEVHLMGGSPYTRTVWVHQRSADVLKKLLAFVQKKAVSASPASLGGL